MLHVYIIYLSIIYNVSNFYINYLQTLFWIHYESWANCKENLLYSNGESYSESDFVLLFLAFTLFLRGKWIGLEF